MKLAAVIPVLFVLVSFCGSPVPEPGGTVSGLAFFDVNRNGIHDSCDGALPHVTVAVTAEDGDTAQATTDGYGAFRIEHAPSGDDTLSVVPGEGFVWPITTTSGGSDAGVAVHVDELQETTGVEIGSASRTAYATDKFSITGIVFNDANANGLIDKDECGIPGAAVREVEVGDAMSPLHNDGTYELLNLETFGAVSLSINPAYSGDVVGATTDWTPTTGDEDADHPCFPTVQPVRRYGQRIYEANVGLTSQRNVGSVAGVLYVDANGNGARDEGESGVGYVSLYLEPVDAQCGYFSPSSADASGNFNIGNVPPGVYTATVDAGYNPDSGLLVPEWDPEMKITVRRQNITHIDLPAIYTQGARVTLSVFSDVNGNGVWDPGERAVAGMSACITPPGFSSIDIGAPQIPRKQVYPSGRTACGQTIQDGTVTIGPVIEGDYSLEIGPLSSGVPFSAIQDRDLNLVDGQQLSLDVPVDVVTPEEQLVAHGGGAEVSVDPCYSDPTWTQPPFDDRYSLVTPGDGGWPDEADAREIYSHGIYMAGSSYEWYVWSRIAGLDTWFSTPPSTCLPPGKYPVAELAGYEPLSSVLAGDVELITVARRDSGLYLVDLEQSQARQIWYIFVDEAGKPVARCGSYSQSCEWY